MPRYNIEEFNKSVYIVSEKIGGLTSKTAVTLEGLALLTCQECITPKGIKTTSCYHVHAVRRFRKKKGEIV
jgi:hypothetical protein